MGVAAGVSDHRGWIVVVCVGERDGVPFVADRRRIDLVDEGVESQPFHHADPGATPEQVAPLVERVRASLAAKALAGLSELHETPGPLLAVALEDALRDVPADLAEVLGNSQLRIAADGALYLDAIRAAAEKLGAHVLTLPRGSEVERAAEALRADEDQVDTLCADLGREIGPPWRKEHRKAAAAAIAALGSKRKLVLPNL